MTKKKLSTPTSQKKIDANRRKLMIEVAEGENNKYITHLLQVKQIALKAERSDPESLANCFYEYLRLCAENDTKISQASAYMAMGINRDIASQWANGCYRDVRYKNLIISIQQFFASYRECLMMEKESGLNPVVGIFWQKCLDGYREDAQPIGDAKETEVQDSHDIASKYKDLLE